MRTGLQTCNICKVEKPLDSFHRNAQQTSGRHPWCKPCMSAKMKASYIADPEKYREASKHRMRKHKYGLTSAEFEAILIAQDFRCAICRRHQTDSRGALLCVDHDHATGMVRGLLCTPCNLAIGYMQDNPATLISASAYLESGGSIGSLG